MPADGSTIVLPGGVTIPRTHLRFEFSRSGGPGGQNVNKVSTRATLLFDLGNSRALTETQREVIRRMLGGRISGEGIMRVVSSKHRTQAANREAAVERFIELLTAALTPRRRRRKTKVPARAHAERRDDKARRSQKKSLRRRPHLEG